LEGSAIVTRDDVSYAAVLDVMLVGDRVQSILVVATDPDVLKAYQPQLGAFLGSFRYGSQVATAPATAAPAPAASAPSAADLGTIKGKGLVGVWMGSTTVIGSYTPEPRWVTFYDDGQVLRDIPLEGLDGFDRTASKADANQAPYWASYTWDGGKGVIVAPGVRTPISITAKAVNQITLGSDVYYRCVEVDGLRLQGSWTSYGDPADPALDRLEPGPRPILTLAKNGRFVDEGIFADLSQGAGGSGTYEMKRYTLTLRYSDGRTKRLAITGIFGADPAAQADIIYLHRSRFNRRK
jgi:hypothetical protein